MPVLMAVMPPVLNDAMASQSPLKNARTGSMPSARQIPTRITVPKMMNAAEKRTMKRVVCMMLGITCSLRPSEEYSDESTARPNSPRDNAITTTPWPPMHCMVKRHMLSAVDMWSRSFTSDAPVVVHALIASNTASR